MAKKLNDKIVTVGLLIFYFIYIVGTYWLGRLVMYICAKILNSTPDTSYFCIAVGMTIETIIVLIYAMICILDFIITTKSQDNDENKNNKETLKNHF